MSKPSSFVMPLLMSERLMLQSFPAAYKMDSSPYSLVHRNFSKIVQREMEQGHRYKMKPAKVIFVGDVSVGKTTIVNRYVLRYTL
mgnify:CR=1 FL=1